MSIVRAAALTMTLMALLILVLGYVGVSGIGHINATMQQEYLSKFEANAEELLAETVAQFRT